ncbi:MAG: CRTAC1 family protein [Planctomycetes bacterium]|nr:CRTAC1 family protein [Planctomycetota bacterium]
MVTRPISVSLSLAAAMALMTSVNLVGCGSNKPQLRIESKEEPAGPPLLRDVTAESNLVHTYRNGEEADEYSIVESLGGGAALIDFDNDGLYDVFVTGGGFFESKDKKLIKGHPCRFFKNLGGMKFKDVTKDVGLDQIDFYTHGVAVADYDRDGWPDLFVTGYGRVALFHNEPVDTMDPSKGRKFVDVTEKMGLKGMVFTTSAAWADFDGDGFPDLYVVQYVDWSWENNPPCPSYWPNKKKEENRDVCPPSAFSGIRHFLFRNNGGMSFTDVSKEAGIRVEGQKDEDGKQRELGKGLGVVVARLDNSRRPSIYVANDTVDNFLYFNRGNWKFEELGLTKGVARDNKGNPQGSMGVDVADYNNSGLASIFVANYENEMHALYRNTGKNDMFTFSSQQTGIASIGQRYVGFGAVFADLDMDGWEDIFIVNGHVIRFPVHVPLAQKPVLFRNNGKGKFVDITSRGGTFTEKEHRGRGLAVGDLDNDGRPDFIVSNINEPVTVLRGIVGEGAAGQKGEQPHWIGLDLKGTKNRDIVGTQVTLEVNGQKLTRFVKGGGSYLSANDPRILVGLGTAKKVDRITIEWSHGGDQVLETGETPVDRYYRVLEGEKSMQPWGK